MRKKKKTLPEELIYEILLKLSVKSLLRCRCVCKSWYNLIKNPNFIKSHLIKNQNHGSIILARGQFSSLKTLSLSFLDYESLSIIAHDLDVHIARMNYVRVCGPCNGLICISHSSNKIVLCNPSLRKFQEIPCPQIIWPEGYYVDNLRYTCIGLGFDSNRNDYKVVCFIHLSSITNSSKFQCLIYDVGIKTWREIDHTQGFNMSYIKPLSSLAGVLLNSALHWITKGKDISSLEKSNFILCLDLNTEVFRSIMLPNFDPELFETMDISLVVFNDSLSLFLCNDLDTEEEEFVEIWVLKQYGVAESWTQQFKVGPIMNLVRPVFVRKSDLLFLVWEENRMKLVSRSLNNDEMEDNEIDGFGDTFAVMDYQESMVSIC